MSRYAFEIVLEDACVFSATGATAGESRSLDHVPGAVLRGVAARALYAELQEEDLAFAVFHQGRVRFGDGLPLGSDGSLFYPTPLSLHAPKDAAETERYLKVLNLAIDAFPEDVQPQQERGGYVTLDGERVAPRQRARLRAAVDPATGRAAERALFAYSALAAGSRFLAEVEVDEALPPGVAPRVVAALTGPLRLGRSRAAEYGRAESRQVPLPQSIPVATAPAGDREGRLLSLVWCLSDLVLTDVFGQPTLTPTPAHFGVASPEARVDFARSFLRFRRLSRYNAALGLYEAEREVIERGSVVAIRLANEADRRPGSRVVGTGQESGLGRVVVDAAFLHLWKPQLREVTEPETKRTDPEPFLVVWARGSLPASTEDAEIWARAARESARSLYASARAYDGLDESGTVGPGGAQWGRILAIVKGGDPHDFTMLENEVLAVAPERDPAWTRAGLVDGRPTSFRVWLTQRLDEARSQPDAALRIGLMAREILQMLKAEPPRAES